MDNILLQLLLLNYHAAPSPLSLLHSIIVLIRLSIDICTL